MHSSDTIATFLDRVNAIDSTPELADVQEEFVRLCQLLPDGERLPFINDYAERLRAKARTVPG